MTHDLQTKLAAPFADSDIEWRLQWSDDEKGSGIAVPYVTNRAIQSRLDKTVGIDCWKNEYIPWHSDGKKASQICGISIYFAGRGEWITKYDGAEDSDIEPVKGGLSDSMKRAAVHWGVGRYLYSMETVFVETEKRGKTTFIKKSSQSKLDDAHQKTIRKLFGGEKPEPLKVVGEPPSEPLKKPSENAYRVMNATIQPSMNGPNTLLQLKGADNKQILAYMQGTNPAISAGAWLENAVIISKEKDGVLFNILSSFDLAARPAA